MTRAEKFLLLHNELETQLRRRFRLPKSLPYFDVLNRAVETRDVTISKNENFLHSLRNLRNILSHAPSASGHIAEPSQEALEKFEAIVNRVVRPPLLRDVAGKPVKVFEETDTLLTALRDMKTNDYSQIVIRKAGRLGLITAEGINQWILREADSVGLLEPATASIRDVGAHEPKASCRFMKPDQTVDDARVAFLIGSSAPSTRLYAILVTHSAKPTEEPLGIVTPWDIFGD